MCDLPHYVNPFTKEGLIFDMLSNYLLGWMGEIFFLKGIHMKNLAKVMFGVAAAAAVTASAAGLQDQ